MLAKHDIVNIYSKIVYTVSYSSSAINYRPSTGILVYTMTPMINRHKPNPLPHLKLENGIVKTDCEAPNFLVTDIVSRKIEF